MIKQNISSKKETIRFIIISVLPEPVRSEITEISEEFYNISGSKTALTYPPHITLRTGAVVPADEVKNYIKGFSKTIESFRKKNLVQSLITLTTPDWIDYRENNITKHLVLYFVEKTPWIVELNKTLLGYADFIKSSKTDFDPHISLAYDDLDYENFERLKKYIIQNKSSFENRTPFYLSEVSLYFQDSDGYWKEYFSEKI